MSLWNMTIIYTCVWEKRKKSQILEKNPIINQSYSIFYRHITLFHSLPKVLKFYLTIASWETYLNTRYKPTVLFECIYTKKQGELLSSPLLCLFSPTHHLIENPARAKMLTWTKQFLHYHTIMCQFSTVKDNSLKRLMSHRLNHAIITQHNSRK